MSGILTFIRALFNSRSRFSDEDRPSVDYYEILGVQSSADDSQIKAAFKRLALECHPDKYAMAPYDVKAAMEFKMMKINEAYALLGDASKRAEYDKARAS
mmetsp:Transcript_19574/g.32100  ORF Transcript_19574/g.32100 Transcript_19574/m.32100 type:complete len:100 (-) Transcript_19574:540-839(-)|eukprot:CAMPEP_0184348918 /NCGR_PEP_ID=MMETSP1089-20130417/32043_1 /TAXON_ID=38269 ORGANISM="Gloeochaete wittrockiana, Strain SAG46.84" /NCGR_SAMPLE_ID=MMETSP1089 /ASSEMBLY_ACC=CAM_ASM_000445 /LENGTH=99 /DNA_ID=CAMNT_0026680919 /DNA_START=108 /DNA_END=407 /DNA_ORIENTATION=-